jgi:hypothetical protein
VHLGGLDNPLSGSTLDNVFGLGAKWEIVRKPRLQRAERPQCRGFLCALLALEHQDFVELRAGPAYAAHRRDERQSASGVDVRGCRGAAVDGQPSIKPRNAVPSKRVQKLSDRMQRSAARFDRHHRAQGVFQRPKAEPVIDLDPEAIHAHIVGRNSVN